ncbi:MAG: C25 family cysteine peptidase [Thermoplasmatota archaeon]
MKRTLCSILIMILLINTVGVFNVISEEEEIITKQKILRFSEINFTETAVGAISLELIGTNSKFLQKNHYIIPSQIETFTFPIGTKIVDVKCTPHQIHEQPSPKELNVAPEPVILGQANEKENLVEDPNEQNNWFEYHVGRGITDNERCVFVKVEVFPALYNQSKNMVKWAEEIEIDIEYKLPEKTVLSFDEEYEFVILSPSNFSTELQNLTNHKINRGLSTKLVTLEEIYDGIYFPVEGRDNPEKIKYFIKETVENWNTSSILLVGGSDEFPVRLTHVFVDYGSGDAEIFASDLYYADIYNETGSFSSWDSNENDIFGEYQWEDNTDDVDLYPDVHLGRLACVDEDEVTTVVNKIIKYETTEAYAQDWFTDLVVIGGDTHPGDEDNVNEGEYSNQHVTDIMDGFLPTKCWASEGTLGTRKFINDAINDGAGFVSFSGHGNPSSWSTHPNENSDVWIPVGGYKNTNVESLLNEDELPVVVTGACSVAKFIDREDCFTWSFVSNPNGGGIASFGPSSLSWGYTGSYTTRGLGGKMHLELFRAYQDYGAITTGEMWTRAINNYISTGMDGGDYKTIQQWQSFCDPTLAIADESLPPMKPEIPEGSVAGKAGKEYTYTALTTDPDGDTISYLFDWGDGTYSGWTDFVDSGENATATHNWEEKGDYQIRVKAKDDHGVQSEWSNTTSISMPKNNKFNINNQFLINHPIFRYVLNQFFSLDL